MWPWSALHTLDERALKDRGLEIPLGELWTPGAGGLLGAAVGLRGCSASFVSPDGLMLTNHHCVYRAIQRNSTPGNNLLERGYLAADRAAELDGQGLRAFVFAGETDVTGEVAGGLPAGCTDLERARFVESREKALVKACEERPATRCRVSRNNDGLRFALLEFTEIEDVRLVLAPPRSLGEFGGEVDNWRWPRHTLDFAFVRAYVGPDGAPAPFGPDNVPYRPARHFAVSPAGIAPGDLVLVAGTPYSTARYRTLAEVREDLEWFYPARAELFAAWLAVLEGTCAETPAACLPVAATIKGLNNGLTNARGMVAGLRRSRVLERKLETEARWREWIAADPARARFAGALDALDAYVEGGAAGRDRDLLLGQLTRGSQLTGFARTIAKWAAEQERPDGEREPGFQERDREQLLADLKSAQRSLHPEADRRVLELFLGRFAALPRAERPAAFDRALRGDWSAPSIRRFTVRLVAASRLWDEAFRVAQFGRSTAELAAHRDAGIRLGLELAADLDAWDERRKERSGALFRLRPPWIESLVAMRGAAFYPDANASPRVSFATVTGYAPRDGVRHEPRTTLRGLAAKATGEEPFDAPPEVLGAIAAADFGPWADADLGDVPACFLSNADTTGGNSGSPALDCRGRLVGLNFDRVYENIAGDYGYNPALSRNVLVEIRAVLWYLDRIARARDLLAELGVESAD
jgi:hypothetical protein